MHGVIINIIYSALQFLENGSPEAIQSNCYVLSEGQRWSSWNISVENIRKDTVLCPLCFEMSVKKIEHCLKMS